MGMIVDSGSYLIAGFKLIFVHQQPCCSNSVAFKMQSQSLAKSQPVSAITPWLFLVFREKCLKNNHKSAVSGLMGTVGQKWR
jgi:hypothetical protein